MSRDESQSQLTALADELSKVRLRGIADVDRDTSKQRRLHLPVLDGAIRQSPWRDEERSVALANAIEFAIALVQRPKRQEAAAALYGVREFRHLTASERQDRALAVLDVPPRASAEHKKAKIRDLREALAVAIIEASGRGFLHPDGGRIPFTHPLEGESITVFEELRMLREGRGISPERVERDAPALLGLPGVVQQREKTNATAGEAAIEFLSCAVRQPIMHPAHFGVLASLALNLLQSPRSYAQRRDDWLQRKQIGAVNGRELNDVTYDDYERRALEMLAELACSLKESPCDEKYDYDKSGRVADNVFEHLLDAAGSALPDTTARLMHLVRFYLPQFVDRLDTAITLGITDAQLAGALLQLTREELREWRRQYLERIDDRAPFYTGDLGPLLLRIGDQGRPFTLSTEKAKARFVADYAQASGRRPGSWEEDDTQRALVRDEAETALWWSLRLLSQVLAYNELTSYWWMLPDLGAEVDRAYMPEFPITRIGALLSAPTT